MVTSLRWQGRQSQNDPAVRALHHSSEIPARRWTGKDRLESIWSCISQEHFTEDNHTGHPHAKGSKANTFLGTYRNASKAHFCHIFATISLKKGNIMSKLPSLASAIFYRCARYKSARIVDSNEWHHQRTKSQEKQKQKETKKELEG